MELVPEQLKRYRRLLWLELQIDKWRKNGPEGNHYATLLETALTEEL